MKVNIGEIKVRKKVNIGEIKMGVKKVYPELENLEVTPIAEKQVFKSKKGGFNIVTVNEGIDTSDGTATGNDLLKGKVAYAQNQQVQGTIEEYDGSFSGDAEIKNVSGTEG